VTSSRLFPLVAKVRAISSSTRIMNEPSIIRPFNKRA
jgi:hypothetical protein